MSAALAISKRELFAYFSTPLAYVFIVIWHSPVRRRSFLVVSSSVGRLTCRRFSRFIRGCIYF